jgi:HEAT repeat protein
MALEDNDSVVRLNAAWSLGAIKEAAAVEPLIQALKDSDMDVRANAAAALQEIGEPSVEPLIRALRGD